MLQYYGVSLFISPRTYAEEKALKSCLSWVYFKRPSDQKPHLSLRPGRKALKKLPRLPIKILLAHTRAFVFFLVQTVVWERQRNKVLGSVEISDKDFSSWHTQGQPHQLCQVSPPAWMTRQRSWLKALWGGQKMAQDFKVNTLLDSREVPFFPLSPFNLSSCWLWRGF